MAHEYFEIPLWVLFEMSDTAFLDMCARYLTDALFQDKQNDIDRQSREYARRWMGWDVDGWILGMP